MLLRLEWLMRLETHLEIREHNHPVRLAVSYATEIMAVVQLSKREEDFPSCKPLLLDHRRQMGRMVGFRRHRGQIPKTISRFRCHLGSLVQCDGFYSLKAAPTTTAAADQCGGLYSLKADRVAATTAAADHLVAGAHRVAATTTAPPQTRGQIMEITTSLDLYHRIRT